MPNRPNATALAAALLAAAALAACAADPAAGDGDPTGDVAAATSSPSPADDPSPSPSSTREPVDVSVVPADPADIDVAYVQAVMDAITEVVQGGYDDAYEHGDTEGLHVAMHATHTSEQASGNLRGLERVGGVGALADPPGRIVVAVEAVTHADADCVEADVAYDLGPLLRPDVDYAPVQPYHFQLVRSEPGARNPTAWVVSHNSWYAIEEPCGT